MVILGLFFLTLLAATPGVGSAFGFAAATVDPSSAKAFAPSAATPRPHKAYSEFEQSFPRWLFEDNEVFLIQREAGMPVVSADSEALCATLVSRLHALGSSALLGTSSYYSAQDAGLPDLAAEYVGEGGANATTMVLVVQVDTTDATDATDLVNDGIDIGKDEDEKYGGLSVILTGRLTTAAIDQKKTGAGFALGDGIGLPFILVLFVWRVGSCKLLLVPLCALGASLVWAYALGHALCARLNVPSFQPNIMLFLCLAFSIDYSFFMLTRFQEERQSNGRPLGEAVALMLGRGGEVVGVSGGLLVLTWLALAFFPVDGLDAIGYCSALAVLCCVLANLLLAPCMLLAFPAFFGDTARLCCCGAKAAAPSSPINTAAPAAERWRNGYYALARRLTARPVNILVPLAILGVMAAGTSALGHLSLSLGVQFTAGDSDAADAYALVQQTPPFSRSGIFATPFAVLARADDGTTIFDAAYFAASCRLAQRLAAVPGIVPQSLRGVTITLGGSPSGGPVTVACDNATAAAVRAGSDAAYRHDLRELTNAPPNATTAALLQADASVITFAPNFNPFTSRATQLVDDVYDAIDAAADEHGPSPDPNLLRLLLPLLLLRLLLQL